MKRHFFIIIMIFGMALGFTDQCSAQGASPAGVKGVVNTVGPVNTTMNISPSAAPGASIRTTSGTTGPVNFTNMPGGVTGMPTGFNGTTGGVTDISTGVTSPGVSSNTYTYKGTERPSDRYMTDRERRNSRRLNGY